MNDDKNVNNESDDLFKELVQQDISNVVLIKNNINIETTDTNSNNNNEIKDNQQVISENSNTTNIETVEEIEETIEEISNNIEDENIEDIPQKNINYWAISSLVFGIASLFFWLLPYIGFATSIIGIMLAAISKKYSNTSISTISIIMSMVGIFISLLYSIFKVVIVII